MPERDLRAQDADRDRVATRADELCLTLFPLGHAGEVDTREQLAEEGTRKRARRVAGETLDALIGGSDFVLGADQQSFKRNIRELAYGSASMIMSVLQCLLRVLAIGSPPFQRPMLLQQKVWVGAGSTLS